MDLVRNHKIILTTILGFLMLLPLVASAESIGFIQSTLWSIVVTVFGRILALCAVIFDFGINELVIGFADSYRTTGVGLAVDTAWVLMRDFMNLAFIFGLLYIGFKIILDSEDSRTRSMLANLLIAALLVNFSLFITKFVVDFSNSLAAEIAVNGFYGEPETTTTSGDAITRYKVDMSADLMNRMGISSIFGSGDLAKTEGVDGSNAYGYIFGTAIFFLITSFVFAAGGILLIIRFAMLNLFMVMSPFMFIGWALPFLGKYTTEYWSAFLKRCFFAPLYFLFVYFSLHIMSGFEQSRHLADSSDSFKNMMAAGGIEAQNAANSTLPFFFLTSIFMLASIIIANKMGADGASQAIRIGNNMRNRMQSAVKKQAMRPVNATGRVAGSVGKSVAMAPTHLVRAPLRSGVSYAGKKLKYGVKGLQDMNPDDYAHPLGRMGAKATRWAARSNWTRDNVLGAAAAMEGAKFGYTRDDEQAEFLHSDTVRQSERRQAIRKGTEAEDKLNLLKTGVYFNESGQAVTYEDIKKLGEGKSEFDRLAQIDKLIESTEKQKTGWEAAVNEAEKYAKDIKANEVKEMSDRHKIAAMRFVKPEVYEALQKDTEIDKVIRDEMKAAYQNKTMSSVVTGFTSDMSIGDMYSDNPVVKAKFMEHLNKNLMTDEFKKLTAQQINAMGTKFMDEFADLFTNAQMDAIKRSGFVSDTYFERLVDKRKDKIKANIDVMRPDLKETLNEQEMEQLSREELMMYKIKTVYDKELGRYKKDAKLKRGKDIAAHIHHDAAKIPKFANYLGEDWIISFGAQDRGQEKLHIGYRKKLVEQWQHIVSNPDKYGGKNSEVVERAQGALDYLSNSQAQKNFMGVDPRDKKPTKNDSEQDT